METKINTPITAEALGYSSDDKPLVCGITIRDGKAKIAEYLEKHPLLPSPTSKIIVMDED